MNIPLLDNIIKFIVNNLIKIIYGLFFGLIITHALFGWFK